MSNKNCSPITKAKKKRLEEIENQSKRLKRKRILTLIKKGIISFIGAILIIIIILVGKVCIAYEDDIILLFNNAISKVEDATKETFNSKQSTKVYDKNDSLIFEFKESDYVYTSYSELNPYIAQAFIAIEDNRFMEHHGMDYLGTLRAVFTNVTTGTMHGASSITQQLTKNMFLSTEQTISRKLEEAIISSHLEKKFTKEEIMEFYVNNIYYGHGNYSFESASQYYFQKNNKDLNLAQIAILAGVINNPTKYDPISNPENCLHRRNRILEKMLDLNFISQEVYDKEVARELELNVQDRKRDNTIKDGTISYAIDSATEILMSQNGFQFQYEFDNKDDRTAYRNYYNEEYNLRREQILTGGYNIYTVIDKELNEQLQEIANKHLKSYQSKASNGIYKKQVAVTVIDNSTGEVVSMVGGRGQDGDYLNRAYQSARQPGSTIKPIVAYTPAFERGYLPSSVMVDSEIPKGPKNANNSYSGSVTLRHAIEKSINTIPYRLASTIGADNIVSYLAEMQFQSLTETDYNPIIAVGGFTKGTTTKEIASAFSTLARGGEFIAPTNIKKISKINTNEVVYENTQDKIRVYDEGASYLTTDSLKGVLTHGTGTSFKPSYPYVAGKTGTTNLQKDRWMVGYTPYYSVAVWVGNDTPAPQSSMNAQGYIWKDIINLLHKDKEVVDFVQPSSVKLKNGQLVNDIYLNKKENNDKKRKQLEDERIKKENLLQEERLALEDYRIIYGLTKEEELEREAKAQEALTHLQSYRLTSENQFDELNELLDEAKILIDDVKHKVAYDRFINTYNSLKSRFSSIKQQILTPPKVEDTIIENDDSSSDIWGNSNNSSSSGSNSGSSSNNGSSSSSGNSSGSSNNGGSSSSGNSSGSSNNGGSSSSGNSSGSSNNNGDSSSSGSSGNSSDSNINNSSNE